MAGLGGTAASEGGVGLARRASRVKRNTGHRTWGRIAIPVTYYITKI